MSSPQYVYECISGFKQHTSSYNKLLYNITHGGKLSHQECKTVLSQTYHIFKPKFYNVHNVFEKQTVIIIYSGIVPH